MLTLALPFAVVLLLSGAWAHRRFEGYSELPSHFNLRGEADRFAPRGVMVWLLPVMFSVLLLSIAAAVEYIPQEMQNGDPRTGILISGFTLLGGQALVLWLTVRWARGEN